MFTCAHCHKDIPPPTPRFCPFCGKPVAPAAPPPAATALKPATGSQVPRPVTAPVPHPLKAHASSPPPSAAPAAPKVASAPPSKPAGVTASPAKTGASAPVPNQPAARTVSSVFVSAADLSAEQMQSRMTASLKPPPALCGMCQSPVVAGERYCEKCAWEVNPTVPDDAAKRAAAMMKQTQFINTFHVKVALTSKNRVVVLNPDGTEGIVYHLNAAQCVCGSVNGVVLIDDPHVSPTHCVFRFLDNVLSVEDAGSVNGVYIKLRGPVALQMGDRFRLGGQTLQVDDIRAHALGPPTRQPGDSCTVQGTPAVQGFRILEVQEGGGVGDSRVVRSKGMVLGRGEVDWSFSDDERVSARHCSISLQGGLLLLQDTKSRNGTYIRLNAEQELQDGDELLVGSHRLRVDILT